VLWRDPDTGRQTSLTYDDEREARVARELIEAAGGRADEAARIAEAVRKPGPTVEAAITEHIDLLTGVGADTRSHYRGQLRAHIAPGLGALPVSAVNYRHVAGWVRAMTEKGLSPKTIANVHGLLSAAMTTAVRLGYRADNPCVGVELPKSVATRDEMTVLTRDEFGLLLSKVSPHYQPLVLTLVATGLRWGGGDGADGRGCGPVGAACDGARDEGVEAGRGPTLVRRAAQDEAGAADGVAARRPGRRAAAARGRQGARRAAVHQHRRVAALVIAVLDDDVDPGPRRRLQPASAGRLPRPRRAPPDEAAAGA